MVLSAAERPKGSKRELLLIEMPLQESRFDSVVSVVAFE